MDSVFQDLRYAARTLRKSPGFTAAAVILLALGIGANTAVFSVVHAVLLRPLPYPQPDRLVLMARSDRNAVSIPEYQFWSQHASAYTSSAGYDGAADRSLDTGTGFEWIKVTRVTPNFLKTLGVAPALGREFSADEGRQGGPQAIVLSDALWRRMFGGAPDVAGRTVTLEKTSYTVTGVLPRDFWFTSPSDAFVPLQPSGSAGDQGTNTTMIARLKPGVPLRQAEAERAALTESFRKTGVMDLDAGYLGLTPVSYQAALTGDVRTRLLLLAGAVCLLLLIACSNLAGLLMARTAARSKEIAVRLALGSTTWRLLWQSTMENLLLSAAGGLAGLLVGAWLLDGLLALAPFSLPVAGAIGLDQPVLWFAFAVALGTSLLFSLAPVAASSRMDISETLKSGSRKTKGGAKTRSILVTAQVALTVTLLVSAALLIQTLYRLHRQELGFSPQGVLTFATPLLVERENDVAKRRAFEAAMLERLKALPGVRGAAVVSVLPLAGSNNYPVEREGHPEQSIGGMEIRRVSPEYFETMGIHILRGRPFSATDRATAPPVILVNETLARQWWGQGDPLGDRIAVGRYKGKDLGPRDEEPIRQIIGVVADTRRRDVKELPRATVYVPSEQSAWNGMNWVVRGNFPPGFAERLRQAVAEIDPRQRVDRIRTMQDIVEASTATSRFDAWLFGIFAGVALLLTAAGIYGVLAFSVARRTREIGMRMALGASRPRVIRMVLGQAFALIAIGLALGLAGAAMVARSLSSLLFNVRPADPLSYAAVAALLLAVGFLAGYLPARRAARVDPMVALRQE